MSTTTQNTQTLPATVWDKIHYLTGRRCDRMVHVELSYDTVPDAETLRTALADLVDDAPVLHARFVDHPAQPYWQPVDYDREALLTALEVPDPEAAAREFLFAPLDPRQAPQLKAALFSSSGRSVFCLMTNHMIMDGGSVKQFLELLFANYEAAKNGTPRSPLPQGDRSHEVIYADLPEKKRKAAHFLIPYRLKDAFFWLSGNHLQLPFEPDSAEDRPYLARRVLNRELVTAVHDAAKAEGYTLNDVLIAAYLHALYDVTGMSRKKNALAQCPVDLRRYGTENHPHGLTNLTSTVLIWIPHCGADFRETLKLVHRCAAESKRNPFLGLWGLPSMYAFVGHVPFAVQKLFFLDAKKSTIPELTNPGVLPADRFSLDGFAPTDGYLIGKMRYKPHAFLSVTTLNGELSLTSLERGNARDQKTVEQLLLQMELRMRELLPTASPELQSANGD